MKQELIKQEEVKMEFDIGNLLPIGLTIVVLGIALAYGLQVMGDVQDDMTANSAEANATGDAILGVAKIPDKLPMIVTVVIAAVIIGIIVRYLMIR
jgi:hypothetical protein